MARNVGPIQFTGGLGNIRSYYDKGTGKYILSTKGGANKNLIMNHPAFARTRDCINEFTGCTKWASLLRRSLLGVRHLCYSRYFSGVMKLAKEIQVRDQESTYGFRAVESSKAPYLLREVNFNREHPFNGVIRDAYGVVFSQDKKTARFSMLGFIPWTRLVWNRGFHLFRFYLVMAQLSDMVWDEEEKQYLPMVKDLEDLTQCTVSEWIINNAEPVDIEMEVTFDEPAFTRPGTTVVVALGVEIASAVNGESVYVTPGNGTLGIIECFVS